jgi:hypothetical protein
MRKALVGSDGSRVAMIVEEGKEFPVAPELKWVDVEADVTERHTYKGKKFIPPEALPSPPTTWQGKTKSQITDQEVLDHIRDLMISLGV